MSYSDFWESDGSFPYQSQIKNIMPSLLTKKEKKKAIHHKIHSVALMRFVCLTECTILSVAFINNLLFGRLGVRTAHLSLRDSGSWATLGAAA